MGRGGFEEGTSRSNHALYCLANGMGEWLRRQAFDQMVNLGLLIPVSNATIKPHFARYRCTLSNHEIVAWFKGASGLGPELGNWGRMLGGHA